MSRVIITTFTDPMMGLSYECEPIFRKLETHFGQNIELRYVMGGLVRNVYDFVDKNDLNYGKEYALKQYLKHLAEIYISEEVIGGLPINMENFQLFDAKHTSSVPLCLAYKAAQLTDRKKADLFLYYLRYATIAETRPTTHFEEILKVAHSSGLNINRFTEHFNNDARAELEKDFDFFESLGVYSLPDYLIQYENKSLLVNRLIGYEDFVQIIEQISSGSIKPHAPEISIEDFIKKHPLISIKELEAAFDLTDVLSAIQHIDNITINKEFIRYEKNI